MKRAGVPPLGCGMPSTESSAGQAALGLLAFALATVVAAVIGAYLAMLAIYA